MIVIDNREAGIAFERRFKQQAQHQGLLAIKQDLSAKYIGGGGVRAFKSDLDYKLIDRHGNIAFIDCKSFEDDSFPYSSINAKQLEKSLLYNDWMVPSGFVVYHRKVNGVVFYTGATIHRIGPGESIVIKDGLSLGTIEQFNLRAILPLYEVSIEPKPTLRPG